MFTLVLPPPDEDGVTHITQPTLLSSPVIDRSYVIEEGGSLTGPGWSTIPALAHREQQVSALRTLGYSETEIAAVLDEADALLTGSRQAAISLPDLPLTEVEALGRAIANAQQQRWHQSQDHREFMDDFAAKLRQAAGNDKPLTIVTSKEAHHRYQDAVRATKAPLVAAEKLRRLRAKRKRRAHLATQSKRANRRQ